MPDQYYREPDHYYSEPDHYYREPRPRVKIRTLSIASVLSLCVNVGLILALTVSIYKGRSARTTRRVKVLTDSICTSCHVFGTSHNQLSTNEKLTMLSARDGSICCQEESEGLIKLLQIMVIRSYIHNVTDVRPVSSAHLYLDTLTDDNYVWTDEYGFGAGHVTDNLEFKNGTFIIKTSGLYFIYSFITLKQRETAESSTKISHSLRKLQTHGSVSLLEKTTDLPYRGQTFRTSYIGGLVRLNRSEQLYVDVSHIQHVYRYAPANFFGLCLLQEM